MSVRRRKDGRWQIDVVVWRGDERIRIRKAAHARNKQEAQEREREERSRLEAGGAACSSSPAFDAFSKDFLDTYAAVNNRASEQATKATLVRVHLVPFFGSMPLDEIGPREIERYKAEKLKTRAAKSVNNHLTVLRKLLAVAVEWERLDHVPPIKWLRLPPSTFAFLDFEEARRLVDAAREWRPMILVALRTGLRQGELLALRWEDVDLTAGRLVVRRSAYKGKDGPPKNGRAREVPLSDDARAALRELPTRFAGGHVFGPFTKGQAKWPLWSACRRAGLRRVGWHVLRHTFASHLVMRGVALKAIQELLGHSTVEMTMRYAHLSPSVARDAVRLLDDPTGSRSGHDRDEISDKNRSG